MAKQYSNPECRSVKSNVCQVRQIKVSRAIYESQSKSHDAFKLVQHVPWLQLKGKWLQQAGFEIDAPVKVRVMDGCLVLTVENEAMLNSPYEIV